VEPTDLLMLEVLSHPRFTSVKMKEEPLTIRTVPTLSLAITVEKFPEDSPDAVPDEVFPELLLLVHPSTRKILSRTEERRREERRRERRTTNKVDKKREQVLRPQLVAPLLLNLFPNSLLLYRKFPRSNRVSRRKTRNVERSSRS
jgi:hypothetical protein